MDLFNVQGFKGSGARASHLALHTVWPAGGAGGQQGSAGAGAAARRGGPYG